MVESVEWVELLGGGRVGGQFKDELCGGVRPLGLPDQGRDVQLTVDPGQVTQHQVIDPLQGRLAWNG